MPTLARFRHVFVLAPLLLAGGACSPGPGASREEGAPPDGEDAAPSARAGRAAWICDVPVGWKIGFVDERFGVPGADLRSAVEEAVALWEEAAGGRRLFRHDPHEGMPVDLEFDDRQRQLEEMAWEERQLDAWAEQLARHPRTQAEVERYNRLVDRYNAALEAYQARPTLQFQVAEYSHKIEPRSGRARSRRITVWAVDSRAGLVSALAHELGHALGLGHVSDGSALMAAEGEAPGDGSAALRPADLEELERVCGSAR